tara:strand:- start:125 stop:418 length:294 start_codon:yes stop_codon:yes gene_type:complete
MSLYTNIQLENFFKKSEKFFNSRYPVVNDMEGRPTLMKESDTRKLSLTLSQTRFMLQKAISRALQEEMYFGLTEAEELSKYYLKIKYQEYKDFILSL